MSLLYELPYERLEAKLPWLVTPIEVYAIARLGTA